MGDSEGVTVLGGGTNISDRKVGWRKNFRVPDVAVFLPGSPAEDRGSHWLGGPDFAVEVISGNDRSREKFVFYRAVGVRELLLVDRYPWCLELFRCLEGQWDLGGSIDLTTPSRIDSQLLPLVFRLVPSTRRHQIEVTCPADGRTWLA